MPTKKRELPNNFEVEKTILGLMIMDDHLANNLLPSLEIDDFYEGNLQNRTIFLAIKSLKEKNQPVDFTTVVSELLASKQLDAVGGLDYLKDLTDSVVSISNYEFYLNSLKDFTVLRKLIYNMTELVDDYYTHGVNNVNDYANLVDKRITEITRSRRVSGFKKTKEIALDVTSDILNRVNADSNTLTGITTGFSNLDTITGGFKKGELIYLAARPAVGKTALALNICYNAANRTNRPVAIFELEMSSETLFKRLLANRSAVEMDKINKGFLNKNEKLKIKEASDEIARVPLYIDDCPGSNIDDVIAKSRKLKNELGDLALIMVDYIGILGDPKYINKNESRQNLISSYSRKLKELSLDLQVPILVLSQLSRKVEDRENKKPQLSDLRESGSLEQDADQVLLIYRPAYYEEQGVSLNGQNDKFKKKDPNGNMPLSAQKPVGPTKSADGGDFVTINLVKNRNGATGIANLLFFKSYGRFTTPAKETENLVSSFESDLNND